MAAKTARRAKPGGGRGAPPTDPDLVAAGLELVRGGRSPEEAAEKLSAEGRPVSSRTLRRAGATTRGGAPAAAPSPPPSPAAPTAGSQVPALPQGGAASGLGLLALVRRWGEARNPAALAELEEALVVAARGETELVGWLARPIPAAILAADMLTQTKQMLALVVGRIERADPVRFGGLVEKANALVGQIERIEARRGPPPPAPDAVEQLWRDMDVETAIAVIELHLPRPVEAREIRA